MQDAKGAASIPYLFFLFVSMNQPTLTLLPTWLAGLLCIALLAGCDTDIEPFSQDGVYSVYGYISATQDRQFIRVRPLKEPLDSNLPSSLDATVTLENLATGETIELNDSLVVFDDESSRTVTYNYWTDVRIQHNTQYELTVDGREGVTRAVTTTPTGANPAVMPDSSSCVAPFTILFRDTNRLPLFAEFRFEYQDELSSVRVLEANPSPFPAEPTYQFVPDNVLARRVPLPPQPELAMAYAPRCGVLDSEILEFGYVYVSPNWVDKLPADGEDFDPTIDQQNIENGAGFFGALRRGTIRVRVDTSEVI
jgi:hypothetical protein